MKDRDTIRSGVLDGKSKNYNYNDKIINRLFFNNIDKTYITNSHDIVISNGNKINNEFFYNINSLGYRTNEFYKSPEFIFSGCSFTYGVGLEEENIWTSIILEKMKVDGINLGLPGKSVSSIINNIYSYIREYGKPKYILCLFPNFNRFELPINTGIMISERNISKDKHNSSPLKNITVSDPDEYIQDIIIEDESLENRPKYSKKPHIAEDILPLDLLYWTAIKQILAFEQYCEDTGIRLVWTTWDQDLNLVINLIKDRYPNQYKSFMFLDNSYESSECHKEQMLKNKLLWDMAGDRDRGIEYAHPGIHFHIHVAEAFHKELAIDEI